MSKHIGRRSSSLPLPLRQALVVARLNRNLTQAELGKEVGLPQMHVSGIETGRVVPRCDTLLDLVRVLGHDVLLVPRDLVPIVEALIRDQSRQRSGSEPEDRPLYEPDPDEDEVSAA